MNPYAFLSYQTEDKAVAGALQRKLSRYGIQSFLAHEDIDVSAHWRDEILIELGKADIFICLLSKSYLKSPWCLQESGIAAFKESMTVIPLSLDGTKPPGFVSRHQSVRVDPNDITMRDLLPALFKHHFDLAVIVATKLIGASGSYRGAEVNFRVIVPHLGRMSDQQMKELLERSIENDQVLHAGECMSKFLPPLLKTHGKLLKPTVRGKLKRACADFMT